MSMTGMLIAINSVLNEYRHAYFKELSSDDFSYKEAFDDVFDVLQQVSTEIEDYLEIEDEQDNEEHDLILERQEMEDFAHDNDYEYEVIE